MKRFVFYLLLLSPFITSAQADADANWVKENFIKKEYYIPMRDGIKLYTAVYTPKDSSQKYPILMQRTPYSCRPYGEANYRPRVGPNSSLMKDKYILMPSLIGI